VGEHYAHVAGYHAARLPLYAARLAVRAPRGAVRLVGGFVSWTLDLEGEPVRLATVRKADPEAYLKLSRQRDSRVRLRVWIALAAFVGAGAVALFTLAAPEAVRLVVLVLVLAVLGVTGAPADRPLIDRAVIGEHVEKLTSDVVVRALGSLNIAAINQAIAKGREGVQFVAPITRDGPGWRPASGASLGACGRSRCRVSTPAASCCGSATPTWPRPSSPRGRWARTAPSTCSRRRRSAPTSAAGGCWRP
jgi:S-DNA-T family DNA segregation ATPase FtsK/SpoIIIE